MLAVTALHENSLVQPLSQSAASGCRVHHLENCSLPKNFPAAEELGVLGKHISAVATTSHTCKKLAVTASGFQSSTVLQSHRLHGYLLTPAIRDRGHCLSQQTLQVRVTFQAH